MESLSRLDNFVLGGCRQNECPSSQRSSTALTLAELGSVYCPGCMRAIPLILSHDIHSQNLSRERICFLKPARSKSKTLVRSIKMVPGGMSPSSQISPRAEDTGCPSLLSGESPAPQYQLCIITLYFKFTVTVFIYLLCFIVKLPTNMVTDSC